MHFLLIFEETDDSFGPEFPRHGKQREPAIVEHVVKGSNMQ